jgi:Skp family chaperone for outer membrane proteins
VNKTLALVAALATTLGLASQVQAQSATKVGFVNIGVVFTKYEKAKAFKSELEGAVKEIKASIDTLGKQIMAWQDEMKKPGFPEKERERYEAGIRNNKRQIEDLQLQAQKKIGKRQEEQLIVIYKEIVGATQGFASANGFHAILAFGDPTDQNDLFNVMNIDRKLKGMDMGGVVPLFFDRSLDVSEAIVGNLNTAYGRAPTPVQGTQTSLPKQ